jgi:SPP1 gp7 family putative phage head morphogenesis protein
MYRQADKLLEQLKKLIQREFNRLGIFGFDELNIPRVTKESTELFDRLRAANKVRYLQAAQKAFRDAGKLAVIAGYDELDTRPPDEAWLLAFLGAYNFVSGYLYESEAERKRLRLAEQILTAKEYQNRTQYNDSLRRAANLWWTQTAHYMLDTVDEATRDAFEQHGVERVMWNTNIDGRECKVCRERNGKIYPIKSIPPKAHRNCRCYITPVPKDK